MNLPKKKLEGGAEDVKESTGNNSEQLGVYSNDANVVAYKMRQRKTMDDEKKELFATTAWQSAKKIAEENDAMIIKFFVQVQIRVNAIRHVAVEKFWKIFNQNKEKIPSIPQLPPIKKYVKIMWTDFEDGNVHYYYYYYYFIFFGKQSCYFNEFPYT